MKKTPALVGGAFAVIAAVATLITNGKTIVNAAVSLYQSATGGQQSSKLTALQRIKRGETFHVLFRATFGDFAEGHTYSATYKPSEALMAVSGFAATVNKRDLINQYPCPDIDQGRINLWGREFYVKDDEIIDVESKRPSGKIQFDSESQ